MANEIDKEWLERMTDAAQAELAAADAMFNAYTNALKSGGIWGMIVEGKRPENALPEIIRLSGEQTKAQRQIIALLSERMGKPVEQQAPEVGLFAKDVGQ